MYYNRKKELLKNIIICGTILAIAVISTYYIYNKFDHSELVDYTSESLDITYKEDNGDKVTITSVSPVTDSVGLSTKAHTITIKNNLTESAKYLIKLTTDIDEMIKDDCAEYQIPIEKLKVAIRYSSGNTDRLFFRIIQSKIINSDIIDCQIINSILTGILIIFYFSSILFLLCCFLHC